MCGGVAIFDFDNDGKLDIFFTNGAQFPEMKKTNPSYYNCLLKQQVRRDLRGRHRARPACGVKTWISTSAWLSATTTTMAMKISSSAAPDATLSTTTTATEPSPM